MDFIDEIRTLSTRFRRISALMETEKGRKYLRSEEATKYALVMPFLQKMGYSVFNPNIVIPEYPAGDGYVDFAIMKDGEPAIVIECKSYVRRRLTLKTERHQLRIESDYKPKLAGYFKSSRAVVGIMTDGITYWFFTATSDKPNVMNRAPFFVFDFLNYTDPQVKQLKHFTKADFDLDAYGGGQ